MIKILTHTHLFILCWISIGTFCNAESLKVFVFAGQSNMHGFQANPKELPEELQAKQPLAIGFTGTEWVALAPEVLQEKGFGPEISFAATITEQIQQTVGIIKFSQGGTSLAEDWNPNGNGRMYTKLQKLVKDAKKDCDIEVVAMIWYQGGKDSREEEMAASYERNLENFIKCVRKDFGNPDMMFLCIELSQMPTEIYKFRDIVAKAQKNIDLKNYKLISSEGLSKGKDQIHFDASGMQELGVRIANVVISTLNK